MKTTIIIAWRNIWRNRRRSLITMGAIFMAVFLSVFMRSMQKGSYELMIQAGINQVGDIQIHKPGYWENQNINNAMILSDALETDLLKIENIKDINPQFTNFGLASSGEQTKAAMIMGAIPQKIDLHTGLAKKLIWGEYLTTGEPGILVAENLAVFLKIARISSDTTFDAHGEMKIKKRATLVQDSLVILSSGYQGMSAYGLFPVCGIVSLPTPQENSSLIFMPLDQAQLLFSPFMPNLVTAVSIDVKNKNLTAETAQQINNRFNDEYEVMTWDQMLTEIVQSIEMDNAGGVLMMSLLYIVVGFGLLGTLIMITIERRREMAVMIAVGMQRTKLILMMIAETIVLGITGVFVGELLSFPFVLYLNRNPIPLKGELAQMMETYNLEPIIPFSIDPSIFINQGIIVFIISILVAVYPIWNILKIKPIDSRK